MTDHLDSFIDDYFRNATDEDVLDYATDAGELGKAARAEAIVRGLEVEPRSVPTTDAEKYAVWAKLKVVEDAIASAVVMAALTPGEAEWLTEEADAAPFLMSAFVEAVEKQL